jgi:hypothetical protein
MGSKSERMGKKYQWIALWRTAARIADRFRFSLGHKIEPRCQYAGPWQITGARDIDPSCVLRRTVAGHHTPDEPCWWAPFQNTGFDKPCGDDEWLRDASRVPSVEHIREVKSPVDGQPWIIGHLFTHLRAPKMNGLVPPGWRRRSIWFHIVGVFVRSRESARLVEWLNHERLKPGENGHGLLPELPHLSECFLGEFPDSAAWSAEAIPYYSREPWRVRGEDALVGCSLLADDYFQDGERDCGRDEVLEFRLPSAEVVAGLGLRQAAQDGHFIDPRGRLVAWDPSVTEQGPSALLLDRDELLRHAKKMDYHILQLVYGEQRAHSEVHDHSAYLGQLLFSGVQLWNGSSWSGTIDARFDPPPR